MSFWLLRIVLLRSFFFIYAIAFLIALSQNEALIGDNGLTPAKRFWEVVIRKRFGTVSPWAGFVQYPSLFWWIPVSSSSLFGLSLIGLGCSLFVIVNGGANLVIVATCWAAQMSIQSVGQVWYGFGWENQLLEMTFLVGIIVPYFSLSPLPSKTPMPLLGVFAFRWLLFRIMLGAGLIKIRGDSCWRDLTAMNYHYETQPVPNPFSHIFHHAPELWHKFETLSNHVIELACPFLLFFPTAGLGEWSRTISIGSGMIQIGFQIVLICSGNLSFLNWLTAIPALCCFDDRALAFLFPREVQKKAIDAEQSYLHHSSGGSDVYITSRRLLNMCAFLLLAYLSVPVVRNLLSTKQVMNASFSAFRVLNTYGAFGSITRERNEVILLGTADDLGGPTPPKWLEYEFAVKPGDINRRSRWISPLHFRIDWLMWFAALGSYQQAPWIVKLAFKLLQNDELVTKQLLATGGNPFAGKPRPKHLKADFYLYKLQPPMILKSRAAAVSVGSGVGVGVGVGEWEEGTVWRRKFVKSYLPPMDLTNPSLVEFLKQRGLSD